MTDHEPTTNISEEVENVTPKDRREGSIGALFGSIIIIIVIIVGGIYYWDSVIDKALNTKSETPTTESEETSSEDTNTLESTTTIEAQLE